LRWAKEQSQKTTVFINSFKKFETVKKKQRQKLWLMEEQILSVAQLCFISKSLII